MSALARAQASVRLNDPWQFDRKWSSGLRPCGQPVGQDRLQGGVTLLTFARRRPTMEVPGRSGRSQTQNGEESGERQWVESEFSS